MSYQKASKFNNSPFQTSSLSSSSPGSSSAGHFSIPNPSPPSTSSSSPPPAGRTSWDGHHPSFQPNAYGVRTRKAVRTSRYGKKMPTTTSGNIKSQTRPAAQKASTVADPTDMGQNMKLAGAANNLTLASLNTASAAGQFPITVGHELSFFEKVEYILASDVMKGVNAPRQGSAAFDQLVENFVAPAVTAVKQRHSLTMEQKIGLTYEQKVDEILKDPFMQSRYAPKRGSVAFQKLVDDFPKPKPQHMLLSLGQPKFVSECAKVSELPSQALTKSLHGDSHPFIPKMAGPGEGKGNQLAASVSFQHLSRMVNNDIHMPSQSDDSSKELDEVEGKVWVKTKVITAVEDAPAELQLPLDAPVAKYRVEEPEEWVNALDVIETVKNSRLGCPMAKSTLMMIIATVLPLLVTLLAPIMDISLFDLSIIKLWLAVAFCLLVGVESLEEVNTGRYQVATEIDRLLAGGNVGMLELFAKLTLYMSVMPLLVTSLASPMDQPVEGLVEDDMTTQNHPDIANAPVADLPVAQKPKVDGETPVQVAKELYRFLAGDEKCEFKPAMAKPAVYWNALPLSVATLMNVNLHRLLGTAVLLVVAFLLLAKAFPIVVTATELDTPLVGGVGVLVRNAKRAVNSLTVLPLVVKKLLDVISHIHSVTTTISSMETRTIPDSAELITRHSDLPWEVAADLCMKVVELHRRIEELESRQGYC
ncbi:hypothetical protein N7495_006183 [Penicillium taxi]|uniref:uncharacterized protein n=1 Tax=Penicillium taxi TaxID=168475 RepID=UPI002544F62E|nr:uncharacterized protein N7495_006183 [Penicillium taxi]KAJ5894492.1 hypothetical protein N7495_006183 [Penicillium taxi]